MSTEEKLKKKTKKKCVHEDSKKLGQLRKK